MDRVSLALPRCYRIASQAGFATSWHGDQYRAMGMAGIDGTKCSPKGATRRSESVKLKFFIPPITISCPSGKWRRGWDSNDDLRVRALFY